MGWWEDTYIIKDHLMCLRAELGKLLMICCLELVWTHYHPCARLSVLYKTLEVVTDPLWSCLKWCWPLFLCFNDFLFPRLYEYLWKYFENGTISFPLCEKMLLWILFLIFNRSFMGCLSMSFLCFVAWSDSSAGFFLAMKSAKSTS